MIVCFVDIGGIVDHHSLIYLQVRGDCFVDIGRIVKPSLFKLSFHNHLLKYQYKIGLEKEKLCDTLVNPFCLYLVDGLTSWINKK